MQSTQNMPSVQILQNKPTKPNQTYQIKPTKPNQTKPTKPNQPTKARQLTSVPSEKDSQLNNS